MRLTDFEKAAIRQETLRLDPDAEIWLIGSRTSDDLKGGDIDLLVVSDRIGFAEKLDLLVTLKLKIGDQKIDITTVSPAAKASDPFAAAVLPKGIRL